MLEPAFHLRVVFVSHQSVISAITFYACFLIGWLVPPYKLLSFSLIWQIRTWILKQNEEDK